jgi:hypothetical protein
MAKHNENERSVKQKKAYEAVKQIALSRKLHAGYQFVLIEDMTIVKAITGMSMEFPSIIVWEHYTGYYFLYELFKKSYTEKDIRSFLFSVTAGKIKARGGPNLKSTFKYIYWWICSLIQIMFAHRPILSLITSFMFVFGCVVFVYSYWRRPRLDYKRKEAILKARKALKLKENKKAKREEEMSKTNQEKFDDNFRYLNKCDLKGEQQKHKDKKQN